MNKKTQPTLYIKDRYWFSFPIEGTKEINRLKTICLD